jgi:hypothetical protein
MAAEAGVSVSQFVRGVLVELAERHATVGALDDRRLAERLEAVASEVRRRLAG